MTMFYQSKDNNFCLYQGNSMQVLGQLTEPVDMIFADPPYFLSNGGKKIQGRRMVSVDKGDWDKVASMDYIDKFNQEWIDACKPLLKDNGTIWVCGTFHNIYSVEKCLKNAGFQIINIITWQKSDPTSTWGELHFNFSSEYVIWARKNPQSKHFFNYELMKQLNGGVLMPDVWKLPTVGMWEKTCGKHPTQKPLRLLYRIVLASTRVSETILDPFSGSCTTGIAANLLGRKFIGIDQSEEFLNLGKRRKIEIEDSIRSIKMQKKIAENPEEVTVMINHARKETKQKMIETGICYLRAGESQGSLCITPGFHRESHGVVGIFGSEAKLHDMTVGEISHHIIKKLKHDYPQLTFRYRKNIEKKEINAALKKIDPELGQTLYVDNASIIPDGGIIEVKDDNDNWRVVLVSEAKHQGKDIENIKKGELVGKNKDQDLMAAGNAIERSHKNISEIANFMLAESHFPYVLFLEGSNFLTETIKVTKPDRKVVTLEYNSGMLNRLDRLTATNYGMPINTNLCKNNFIKHIDKTIMLQATSIYTQGDGESWDVNNMFNVMLEVANTSL